MENIYLALAITLFIVIITFLFILFKRLRKSTDVVLLTGLSDAGKTTIFSSIIFNKPKKSVTSLKENEAINYELNLKLIDLPGADRLRARYWERYRIKARHIMFIIDSTTVESKIRDISEYLYVLLSDRVIYNNKINFTIVCNKQDLDGAKKKEFIMKLLENELNAIKATKTGQLAKTSDEEEEDYLEKNIEKISFDLLNVKLIETSLHNIEQIIKTIL